MMSLEKFLKISGHVIEALMTIYFLAICWLMFDGSVRPSIGIFCIVAALPMLAAIALSVRFDTITGEKR